MFELQRLAFQADITRGSTLMFGREVSARSYPEIGVPDGHHPLSHSKGDGKNEKLTKIILNDEPIIYLYHKKLLFAHSKKLEGYRPVPDGLVRVTGLKLK